MKSLYLMCCIITMLFLCSPPTPAQWMEAGRKQSQNVKGNGALLVHEGTMYFWNEENHFQISTNNGSTWIDPTDSIQGANPHVRKMAATSGRLYAGLNFGTGNGIPIYSTDKGATWMADTLGAPGHALGWSGLPAVSDIYAWGHWLYVKWDKPKPYSIKSFDTPYVFDSTMNVGANNPSSVIAKGDTLFAAGSKIYYTTNGGATWVFPANKGYTGYGGKLFVDGSRLYMFAFQAWLKPCYLYYSDDNAENWTEVDISVLTTRKIVNGDPYFPIAAFIKGNRIEFVAGQDGFNKPANVWKSTDMGKTWSADTAGLPTSYIGGAENLAYTPDGYLWCVPSYENIYKQKIDAGTGTSDVEDSGERFIPIPNPCRESFSLSLQDKNYTEYELCDNMGRCITKQHIDPGTITLHIQVNDIARGYYWLLLTSDSGRKTAQAIILE